MNVSDQIAGLRHAGAGSHPMRRDDYRRPIREAMLRDARQTALVAADAPSHVVQILGRQRLADWPDQARLTCFGGAR